MTPRSRRVSRFVACFTLCTVGACASAAGGGDDDDTTVADAAPGTPDARPGTPDARPGTPDAHPGTPDAHPGPPDANLPPDASTGTPCTSGAVCSGAMSMPSVSGDTGADKQVAQGYQSAWYRLRVTEDDSGITAVSTSVEVKLTSPVGTDFDVFVYVNTGNDVAQECSTTYGNKSTSGNVKTVLADWGESGLFSNGSDDGRNVSIEIRPISGVCSVGQVWQLEVTGNQ